MEKILKAIIPFCCNGWIVFIDIQSDKIEYGLLRAFNGPKGLTATQILFVDNENIELDYGLVEIKVLSNYELEISSLGKKSMIIDFRLTKTKPNEKKNDHAHMIEDITSNVCEQYDRKSLTMAFHKLMDQAIQRVHGTICIVVKKEYVFPNEFLSDGTWLKTPINLSENIMNSDQGIECERYYALSGLLLEMMNVDGITIIDNAGKIRGFNIFINQASVKEEKIAGGARKRAAYSILRTKDQNILGVYFQSQDGNAFYERMCDFE